MSSEGYHEDSLSEETKDFHRALVSLGEELEAVDWYQQRAEACSDESLRQILGHNRDEEVEHAMMILEWLRRTRPAFARTVATYLNSAGSITTIEEREAAGEATGGAAGATSLGIGSLRGEP